MGFDPTPTPETTETPDEPQNQEENKQQDPQQEERKTTQVTIDIKKPVVKSQAAPGGETSDLEQSVIDLDFDPYATNGDHDKEENANIDFAQKNAENSKIPASAMKLNFQEPDEEDMSQLDNSMQEEISASSDPLRVINHSQQIGKILEQISSHENTRNSDAKLLMDSDELNISGGGLKLASFNSEMSGASQDKSIIDEIRGIAKIDDSLNMIEQEQENFLNKIEYKLSNNRSKQCLYCVAVVIMILIQFSILFWSYYIHTFSESRENEIRLIDTGLYNVIGKSKKLDSSQSMALAFWRNAEANHLDVQSLFSKVYEDRKQKYDELIDQHQIQMDLQAQWVKTLRFNQRLEVLMTIYFPPDMVSPSALKSWKNSPYKLNLKEELVLDYDDFDPQYNVGFVKNSINGFYEGQMDKSSKKWGIGRYVTRDGGVYEGFFKNDQYHGYGRLIFNNGDLYLGEFSQDGISGEGTYEKGDIIQTGTFLHGVWVHK